MPKQLLLVLALLSAELAWAQQIYPPSQSSARLPDEQKKVEHGSDDSNQGVSDINSLGSASRYLLAFPPPDPGKPLSEWIPVQAFDSAGECARALPIAVSTSESMDFPRMTWTSVNFGALYSRCISLAQFKPPKEANVIVSVTSLGTDPGGFSTWVLHGRVFNGGRTTAQNVVVRYRVRDARGIIYGNGEILPVPQDIPPLTFAEYRGPIVGSAGGSDRWVETEAKWSKD